MQNTLENIKKYLHNNDNFLITSHVRSDGDSIGSELAMAGLLKTLGKSFYILNNDQPAEYLRFLPGIERISTIAPHNHETYKSLIILDGAFSDRVGEELFKKLFHIEKENIIAIDHHPNLVFNDKCYIDPSASSTGELVYNLLEYMEVPVSPEMAVCLYTAIFTDTGCLRQTNTTSRAIYIISKLFDLLPYSHYQIVRNIYESSRYEGLMLLADMLSTVVYEKETGIIYGYITNEMMIKRGAREDDIENFIEPLRGVAGIKVAAIFRETGRGEVRVNLRAKADEVNLIPFVKKLGGGGHPKAAGFSVFTDDLNKAISDSLSQLRAFLSE